ncbi:MAG: glycosyltransferase family 2 protein [Polaromonas sp.]|nr:glycosyltransferase family 2 protein [Polaromonas sp.]MBP9057900.1 glycosyltransferase family 2 protein [Polaromonas sp.]
MTDAETSRSQNKRSNPSISCVMPAYNEAGNLGVVVPHVIKALNNLSKNIEIIVVNDGSRDATAKILADLCTTFPQIVALNLSRNFGKEAALTAGLEATQGDVVVILDADGQHPVDLIPEMLQKWVHGSDVVYAIRKTRHDQSALQIAFTSVFYKLINWRSRVQIPANAGDFRLMDKKVVLALRELPERNRFMKGLYAWVGFNSTAIDYEPLPRADGQSNFGFRGAMSLAMTGLMAFSVTPLRLVSYFGLMLSLASLGYGAWVIFDYFWFGADTPGYATIVVGMMFLSGIQLLSIGVLAEYVGRIYEEVKQRPMYLIGSKIGKGLQSHPEVGQA